MKFLLATILMLSLSACSSSHTTEKVYLQNPLTGDIVKCEFSSLDSWINAMGICITQKQSEGYVRIEVTEFNSNGYPVEYYIPADPFWPEE